MMKLTLLILMLCAQVHLLPAYAQAPDADPEGEIVEILEKVLDWQIEHFSYREKGDLHDYGVGAWTNGVLYLGASGFAAIADKKEAYYEWLRAIGGKNSWRIPSNFSDNSRYGLYHADELCIGQFYINMYDIYGDPAMIRSTRERLDRIMARPPGDNMSHRDKKSWTWCDALFMAPPVYAGMSRLTGNEDYLRFMHREFLKTYNHLYDPQERLFYRDDSYIGLQEANGEKVFWGRGNGWVVAGIANILQALPEADPQKRFYVNLLQEMLDRLASLREPDGFWHASLLDTGSYPAPETSATAMIVYAMACGVNNGYLDADRFKPLVLSSWEALESVIGDDGKPGYVQPIGADPKEVTQEMTAVYGVGALLMAGTEIYKMKQFE